MVLIDASTRWLYVSLLSSHNPTFRLQAHFSDYPIKKMHLDNAGEFISQTFNNYCMSIGINVEHLVVHVLT